MFIGCAGILGVSVLPAAQQRGPANVKRGAQRWHARSSDNAKALAEFQREFARLNAVLLDDGRWAIAGVVALGEDDLGRRVIGAKKDGDFETDAVLTLFVPLFRLATGELVPAGIASVKNNPATLTITVHEAIPNKGGAIAKAAANGCTFYEFEDWIYCFRDPEVCPTECYAGPDPDDDTKMICDCTVIVMD